MEAGAGHAGRRRVNVVPWPRRLSARRRPWWASTMSRQTERPRPVPPRPVSSGPCLGGEEGVEDVPQVGRRDADAGVGDAQLGQPARWRPRRRGAGPTPLGHGLPGVDHQVQEHLLDLCGVDPGIGAADGLEVDVDAVPRQVLARQQNHLLGEPDQVGRLAAVGVRPRQAEHAAGDRRSPLGGFEDLLERPLAILRGRGCGGPAWRS